MKKQAIIIDLDGTLCQIENRLHFLPNFDLFNGALLGDTPNNWCSELLQLYSKAGYDILLVTGRGEKFRELTIQWLDDHHITYTKLYMRKLNDQREDDLIKEEIYVHEISDHYEIRFVVDDRKIVVDKWRALGLVCLQCAPGLF